MNLEGEARKAGRVQALGHVGGAVCVSLLEAAGTDAKAGKRGLMFACFLLSCAAACLVLAPGAFASKAVVSTLGAVTSGTTGGLFNQPRGVAVNSSGAGGVPAGSFFVADGANHRIQQFDANDNFVQAFGNDVIQTGKPGDTGTGFEICTVAADCKNGATGALGGELNQPTGLSINESTGALYVSEAGNRRVTKFTFSAGVPSFDRSWGWDVIQTGKPGDAGTGFEVCTVAADCKIAAANGSGAGQFNTLIFGNPAVNPADGSVYVADPSNRRVQRFSSAGAFLYAFGGGVLPGGAEGTGDLTAASTSVTAASTAKGAFLVGQTITGAGIAPGTKITAVAATTLTLSQAAEANGTGVTLSAAEDAANKPVNERQTVSLAPGISAGKFKLTFTAPNPQPAGASPKSTEDLPFNATAAEVQAKLESLTNIGAGNVSVTLNPGGNPGGGTSSGGPWTIEFLGRFADTNVAALTAANGAEPLVGGTATVSTPREGASALEKCVTACLAGVGGSDLGQFGGPGGTELAPTRIAVDSSGILYAVEALANFRVQRFNSASTASISYLPAHLSGTSTATAPTDAFVDPSTDELYVAKSNATPAERRVLQVDTLTATLIDTHAQEAEIPTGTNFGIGVNSTSGRIYLSSSTTGPSANHFVFVLDDPVPPAVTIDPVTTFDAISATFSGTVDPTGQAIKSCTFQYSSDGITWQNLAEPDCPGLAPGGGAQAVSQAVSGLEPATTYQVRLTATKVKGGGSATSSTTSFTTDSAPPTVSGLEAAEISDTGATLRGTINAHGKPTKFRFEYTDEEDFLADGFTNAVPIPVPDAAGGSGTTPLEVSKAITGLESSTTYYFRLVAENDEGPTESAEESFTTFSPAPDFEACPNDEFRKDTPSERLPDCRAWEMASPIDKNAGSIQGTQLSTRTSEDGSTISFESPAGIPGGDGAQEFATYMAKRADDGDGDDHDGSWSTTGLLPDPSSGQRAAVRGWTADFTTVFDQAELLSQGASFVARDTATGTQTEILPHTPPPNNPRYGYVGASADGDTVIFGARPQDPANKTLQLTPNAAPGMPNLYAWDRESGELHLAGVLPDGSTPTEGSQARRGMDAGEYNYDTNIVGEDGSVLFSDRETGQLYLRLNPTAEEGDCEADPTLACTIHVSASQYDEGKGPGGTDAAGTQPAIFMAASPDHSKITFTSSEKLTNDATTGPEPDAPAIARAVASDGSDKKLTHVFTKAREIAVDETEEFIYWSDPEGGQIGRAKFNGTAVDPDYIDIPGEPIGIAVEPTAGYIFWTDRGELTEDGKAKAGAGTIGRVDIDGSDIIADCYIGLTNPRSIAVRSDFIYWTMPGMTSSDINIGGGDVGRAGLNECADEAGKNSLFIDGRASGDIAVNATHIYTTAIHGNSHFSFVNRYLLDGTPAGIALVEVLSTDSPMGLALDATHLYWTDVEHNKIGRSDLNGSGQEPNFIPVAGRAEDPARGGADLFWSVNQKVVPNQGADIYQLDRDSGVLTDLAPDTVDDPGPLDDNGVDVRGVLGVSEDGSYVYFAANGVPNGVGNSPNDEGEVAEPGNCQGSLPGVTGTCNLYVAHDGDVEFIARLDAVAPGREKDTGDAVNWAAGHSDVEKLESDKTARVSGDGRVLVFRSSKALAKYDNEGPRCVEGIAALSQESGPCLEFYRFDYDSMSLACLTCNPTGATPEGPARLSTLQPPNTGAPLPAATLGRNLSADGNRFFFESIDALVAADTNGEDGCPPYGGGDQKKSTRACQDVYEWEAPGTGSCTEDSSAYSAQNEGCIYLISTGKSKDASFFADADLDGDNVFVFTYEQLVPQDKDNLLDAYDARVGGGLASQHQVEDDPCTQPELCKPPPAAPPAQQSPGSAGFAGPSDPQPQRAHKKKRKKHKKRKRAKRKRGAKAKQKNRKAKQRRAAARSRGAVR